MRLGHLTTLLLVTGLASIAVQAQVLPEERADILYHSYDGGGVKITGPSFLARSNVGDKVSLSANYYVDSISSASIDVLSYASPYEEERNELSLGADFIVGEALVSAGYTNSDENDFEARTAYLGISQEIFGGLTTVKLGFAKGKDKVGQVTDPMFSEDADRRIYRLGVSQVMTKNLVMNFDFEGISDEGYLNNPYRQIRFLDPMDARGYRFQQEVYPRTRSSSAFAVNGRYFIDVNSAIYGGARVYDDTWGISAWNAQAGYTYRWRDRWLFDLSFRLYDQSAADFFSDLFPFQDAQNFLGRDKEISTYTTQTVKLDVSYEFLPNGWGMTERGTVNLSLARIMFDYDDFRDILAGGTAGDEPFYNFDADVLQFYLSFWF